MVDQYRKFTTLQLFLKCIKLKNLIDFGKLDSFVEVFEKLGNEGWENIGTTEVINNSNDPAYLKSFIIKYYFEEHQLLNFKIFNSEDGEPDSSDAILMGEANCSLGEILGSEGQTLALQILTLSTCKFAGYLVIKCEYLNDNSDSILLQLGGEDLEDVSGLFGAFEPFIYVCKSFENCEKQRIYMSEYIAGRNVVWQPFKKKVQELCQGRLDTKIIVDAYDFRTLTEHQYIASAEFTLDQVFTQGIKAFPLINPKKKEKSSYKGSGMLKIVQCEYQKEYNFIDYLKGGCQISLEVAIDFTGSNRHPSSPSSLHYLSTEGMNQYQQALLAVSQILLQYDSDKKVPMYGFGGKIQGVVSHCFSLSTNPDDPFAYGIEGIMQMYSKAMDFVGLSGPTRFSEVLQKVVTSLEEKQISQENQEYTILLILTDGEIHDMKETIDWIVRGCHVSLSIVIVGIGNENFENMKVLDADDKPLIDSNGRKMMRDIVQFVPFRDVNNSPHKLAKEVLDEIPREIVNFFKLKNIVPNSPTEANSIRFDSVDSE